MVDAVISFVVEKLGNALIDETYFLLGVRGQVKSLQAELIRMQCFLKDADAKEQQGDNRVRNWVAEIRDIAYDAEDVIDTFLLKVNSSRSTKGINNLITRKALMVKNIIHLRRVGYEVQDIQGRLKSISDSRVTYGIQDLGKEKSSSSEIKNQKKIQHPLRNRHPHVEDNDVIGFKGHTKKLLAELMKDDVERCVVSIFGVGGIGKTTLATKIYRHDSIKSHFDCCGWSSISQQLNLDDVLREIMECMSLPIEGNLTGNLYNYLKDKRYLIILDDVWNADHWDTLIPAFPTGNRGSKVLLTTRNKKIAEHADPWSLHFEPPTLNDDDSWELLRKKTFPKNMTGMNCNPEGLEMLGREMVRECGGLPLRICVLGGILKKKRLEIKQWEDVHKDVISYISKGENGGVNGILALSYHDLPSYLKPCFLYLGLFPEDYAIPRKKLIQLWVAESFIPHAEENLLVTMEDIGKKHLAELSDRGMIQLGKGNIRQDRKFKFGSVCQVHDLMRDLCLSKAEEINFLKVYNLQHCTTGDIHTLNPVDSGRKVRRYATHLNIADPSKRYEIYISKSDCTSRTLFVIVPYVYLGFPLAPINYQKIKLLRVLDLENVGKYGTNITKEVSKLIHLRYLNLGNLSESLVSSSIGNLRNLQTLKLFNYRGNLPETVSKLVQLRHLNLIRGSVDPDFQIKNLINLQTVDGIEAGKWISEGCLEKLSNIRDLSVCDTSQVQNDIIVDELVRKGSSSSLPSQYQIPIRNLCINSSQRLPNSIFESLSCCHNLHTLNLRGRLAIINLQKYPPNLTKLYLNGTYFKKDPMAILQHLRKLRILSLNFCMYDEEEMVCYSEGFPELENLSLCTLQNVKEWIVERGGMPHLKELLIDSCSKLSMLPEGLRFINSLKTLKIQYVPLVKERVAEGGEDWYKVQHIPSIIIE